MKFEFSQWIFKKIGFHEPELFHAGRQTHRWTDRQTGGHNKADSRSLQNCKCA